jgi:hypothetical protein
MVSPADDLARFDVGQIAMMVELVDSLAARIGTQTPRAPASSGV